MAAKNSAFSVQHSVSPLFLVLVVCGLAAGERTITSQLFGELTLVQEVDCSRENAAVPFAQSPAGSSTVETILGVPCRVLPNLEGDGRYFACCIGIGKGSKAGGCYVLNVEFPDDKPRGFQILNWGCETARGLATGTALGDALQGLYVNHNAESLHYPQSGTFQQWRSLFFLHDRFPELARPRGLGLRPLTPADGFWVILAQFPAHNDPLSAGAGDTGRYGVE